jgi:hypothetical protein
MDIEKEREAFEGLPLAELAIKSEYVYYNEETNSYWPNEDFCPSDAPETMNFAWEAWQAAKAQAVPKGFVVVPKESTRQIYRTFYDAFNSANAGNTAQCFKVAYKAMIEAAQKN